MMSRGRFTLRGTIVTRYVLTYFLPGKEFLKSKTLTLYTCVHQYYTVLFRIISRNMSRNNLLSYPCKLHRNFSSNPL